MALTREATTAYSAPVGSMKAFGGSSIPTGWLLCDGTAISRTTYVNLFAAISTAYGVGNGSSTFNLPDLRGRVAVGKDSGTFAGLGSTGGEATHVLSVTEMPSHSHTGTTDVETTDHTHSGTTGAEIGTHTHAYEKATFGSVAAGANQIAAVSSVPGTATGTEAATHTHSFTSGGRSSAHAHTFTTATTGSGSAHNNLQPYQVVNHIIKF